MVYVHIRHTCVQTNKSLPDSVVVLPVLHLEVLGGGGGGRGRGEYYSCTVLTMLLIRVAVIS